MSRRSNAVRRWLVSLPFALLVATTSSAVFAQDVPDDADWTTLLARRVVRVDDGHASRVDDAGIATERAVLDRHTTALSAVSRSTFDRMDKPRRMAPINANDATIRLVLMRYPSVAFTGYDWRLNVVTRDGTPGAPRPLEP